MSLDCSGALFCTLSLIFKEKFDALAAVRRDNLHLLILPRGLLTAFVLPRRSTTSASSSSTPSSSPSPPSLTRALSAGEHGRLPCQVGRETHLLLLRTAKPPPSRLRETRRPSPLRARVTTSGPLRESFDRRRRRERWTRRRHASWRRPLPGDPRPRQQPSQEEIFSEDSPPLLMRFFDE